MFLPPLGSQVAGKYRLESLLGEGGMGAVFRARHEIMGKPVAVKWLKPTCGDEVAARHRFMQEARAAARIRHPNVVDVYDVGEQDGCLFMVMELLEGETFGDFLEHSGVPVTETIRHLLAAMRGAAAAHAAGITHRDIKPENVFIAVDPLHVEGVAKILDFGISKLHDEPQPQLSLAGTTMGTPHYMSYEQIRCVSDVDHRTDVYAFGVLLYQALTGALPYDADTVPGIVMRAASGRAVRPIELRPDLPPELDELVMRAIALEREDRFQSMDAMINALTRIQFACHAWFASPERATSTPRQQPSTVLLLDTPRPPNAGQEAASPQLVRPDQRPAPTINRWLGLVSVVAIGVVMGSTLYTQLMTPVSASSVRSRADESRAATPSAKTSVGERASASSSGHVTRTPAQLPQPVVTAVPARQASPNTTTAPAGSSAPLDSPVTASQPTSSAAVAAAGTAQPVPVGPTTVLEAVARRSASAAAPADNRSRAEAARASTVDKLAKTTRAWAPGPETAVSVAVGGPESVSAASASAETETVQRPSNEPLTSEEAPSPATRAHRSGPLKLEEL